MLFTFNNLQTSSRSKLLFVENYKSTNPMHLLFSFQLHHSGGGVTSLSIVSIRDCTGQYDDDEKVWMIIIIMNCVLFLCQGRKNNWYNELFMIISLSTPRLEATCWQLLLSSLQSFQQINWRTEIFIDLNVFFLLLSSSPGLVIAVVPLSRKDVC